MSSSVGSLSGTIGQGRVVIAGWLSIPEPAIAGMIASEPGFGAVVLDMQHGAYDLAAAARAIPLVAAAGKSCLVRVPVAEFGTASRLLDSGAAGIVAPMINTVADARAFAAHVKFPPLGLRSWGPQPALALTGLSAPDYFAQANGFTLSFAMVETREALGIIDDILAMDGIDGVFIGPFDLSIGLSNGASLDPTGAEVGRAIDHALARTRAAGKRSAIYAATGERAAHFARLGYDLVALGSDVAFLRAGAAAMLEAAGG